MGITCLQRIHHPKNLGRVSTGRSRIRHDQANRLFRIDDEDGSNGEGNAFLIDVGRILMIDPICMFKTPNQSPSVTYIPYGFLNRSCIHKSSPFTKTRVNRIARKQEEEGEEEVEQNKRQGAQLIHIIEIRHLPLLIADDGKAQSAARDLIDILDPAAMALDRVGREPDELDLASTELGLELGEGSQLRRADGRVIFRVRKEHDPLVTDELVEINRSRRRLGLEVGRDGSQAEAAFPSIRQFRSM